MSAYDIVYENTMSYVSIRYRISAYDIVRQHTMSYVSIRCRTSAYDVVRQHTMSYVSIRCRTSTYDVVYDMAMHWTLSNDGRCGGGGDLTKQSEHAFLARILEASDARSFVTLDVLEGLKQNEVTWTDSTRDQRTPCTPRTPRAHACMSRGACARRGRVHTCDVVLDRSRKSHHRLHDRVIATNDWSSVCNVEHFLLDSVDHFIRCRSEKFHDEFSDFIAVLLRSLVLSLLN